MEPCSGLLSDLIEGYKHTFNGSFGSMVAIKQSEKDWGLMYTLNLFLSGFLPLFKRAPP